MDAVATLTAHGLTNADAIVSAASAAGVPLWVAAAVIEKESGGRNVYGNDRGGVFSTPGEPDIEVTEDNYREFEALVLAGAKSNGVGPAQITFRGFIEDAKKRDVRLWVPVENVTYGMRLVAKYLAGRTDDDAIAEAGTLYNKGNMRDGVNPYGHDLVKKAAVWRDRLTPEVPPMRDWLTHLPYVTRQSWPNGNGLDFYPAGRMTTPPRVIVLHSTETTSWPGYNSGAANPHFTINLVSGEVRQHVPLSWGSRCLAVSSDGVIDRTVNVSGTIQIEIIGAVTPGYPAKHGHYDLPNRYPVDERAQAHLARLLRAIADETGIPLQTSDHATWVAYPGSYGVKAKQRLSSADFRDARGIVGHQHAPANNHGDGLVGRVVDGVAVDLERTLTLAREGTGWADDNKGFDPVHLERVESLLDVLGYEGVDVWARTRTYQADNGLEPDGLPGPATTAHLEDTMSNLPEKIAAAVWSHRIGAENTQAQSWLRGGNLKAGRAANAAQEVALTIAGQEAAIKALTEALGTREGINPEQLSDAVQAAMSTSLAALKADVTLTVTDAEPTEEKKA